MDSTPPIPIDESQDLPALHRSTDTASQTAQRHFLWWTKLRFCAVVVAALGGAITWDVDHHHVRLGAWIALIAFAIALVGEVVLAITRPDKTWYEGRAAAESVKTLAWRYMMRADLFAEADVDQLFTAEVLAVLDDLDDLPAAERDGEQITRVMRRIRALDFEGRRSTYLHLRIRDQQGWYSDKSNWNRVRAHVWVGVSIAFEVFGLIGALLKVAGTVDIDLLGVCAAVAAAATAWLQAKQHQNLSTSYSITSQELAAVGSEVEAVTDEQMWAKFVGEAEEAISREHTLWRASRGVLVRRRRD